MTRLLNRRGVLTGLTLSAPAALLGCDRIGANNSFQTSVLGLGEWLSYRAQRLFGANALAPEFAESDMSPEFRTNGNTQPASADYQKHQAEGFVNWKLMVDGLVMQPKTYSLADLRAMPARTQITQHDCVEGWSAIGKWTGTPLGNLLTDVQLKPEARYLVMHCADDFSGTSYYESIDLVDGFHPQTILAYQMNDADLTVGHGAPIRLRVERQLGYKHAKYVMRIEAVSSLAAIGGGRGGFWEDVAGYNWYAGI